MPARDKRPITRRRFLKAAGILGAAAAAGCGLEAALIEPEWIEVTRTAVALLDLPDRWDSATIAHLSDLHFGPLVGMDYLLKAVNLVNDAEPDIIVITGDFISGRGAANGALSEMLSQLRAPEGVMAVPGNHDRWSGFAAVRSAAALAGVEVLTNSHRILARGGQKLCIAGVDDLMTGRPDLAQALGGVPDTAPRVLLAHNPDYAEQMPASPRVDLMLCGHTHGGQIRLPLLGALALPIRHRQYAAGLVHGPQCNVYISRGIGMVGIPIRFNCRPELALITLHRA